MARGRGENSRRFSVENAMWEKWCEFKEYCDNATVTKTEFSQRLSEFVTAVIPAPITYTLKGFCNYIGMTEQNFYETYAKNEKFESVIGRMREECELDARKKFENGTINSRLAGLWMSRYNYTTNVSAEVDTDMELKISVDYGDDVE